MGFYSFFPCDFGHLDGSDETRIFANGLVDDVITRLSRVPGLLVSSRGDAFTLEPNSASGQVRQRLRVAMYLEGSVQIAGVLLVFTLLVQFFLGRSRTAKQVKTI